MKGNQAQEEAVEIPAQILIVSFHAQILIVNKIFLPILSLTAWPYIIDIWIWIQIWITIRKMDKDYVESDSDDVHQSSQVNPADYDEDSSEDMNRQESNSEEEDEDSMEDEDAGIEDVFSFEEQLERDIMREAICKEKKRNPFQEEVMADIVDKLKDYESVGKDKIGEDLVTLRIQELVYNKLLVMSYACNEFRLVRAHYRLGAAYLKHDCPEQAIEHLSTAIYKNEKLFQELPRVVLFQCSMQNLLGECLMKKQEYYDAIEILRKASEVAARVNDEESDLVFAEKTNIRSRILLAQCFYHHKEYEESIAIINEVLESTKRFNEKDEDYAFALVEKANILSGKGDNSQAVVAQEEAINILIQTNYPKPEEVAQMYEKLGEYFDKLGNPESSLACVQKVKTLYQQIYSGEDKRVIKARRKIATSLLKNERFKEAVNELVEIVELEEKVFGESSLQTARTLKLLGTVYISLEMGDARSYLKRAMNIFNSLGSKKQVQEIKEKLRVLMNANTNNQDLKVLSEQDL